MADSNIPRAYSSSATLSVLSTYPHLAHYIFNLLSSITPSPSRSALGIPAHHPLSISSSGDDSDEEDEDGLGDGGRKGSNGESPSDAEGEDHTDTMNDQKTPKKSTGDTNGFSPDREALVKQIVDHLDNDEEDEVKEALKVFMGDLGKVSLVANDRV